VRESAQRSQRTHLPARRNALADVAAYVPERFPNNCNDRRLTEGQLLRSASVKRKQCGSPTKHCCANLNNPDYPPATVERWDPAHAESGFNDFVNDDRLLFCVPRNRNAPLDLSPFTHHLSLTANRAVSSVVERLVYTEPGRNSLTLSKTTLSFLGLPRTMGVVYLTLSEMCWKVFGGVQSGG